MSALHSCWITAEGETGSLGNADALFPWWSFTKTVIAISALQLQEAGRLDLGRPEDGASLRQLLRHEAGLGDYAGLPTYRRAVAANAEPWTPRRMMAELGAGARPDPQAQGWRYSNPGYMLARARIEAAAGCDFGSYVERHICAPLGLNGVRLARSRQDMAAIHWPEGRDYHPGWVYHGLLLGSAREAAALLHGLAHGALLSGSSLAEMQERRPLGGAIEGRPWQETGYALGLMSGRLKDMGRAWGHSGGGPFCVNAVYTFPDLAPAVTVASFTDGWNEAPAEWEALRLAQAIAAGEAP